MENFVTFIILILTCAAGTFGVYLLIDFFEYLKKYHAFKWAEVTFERPFGISQKDFFFYPIRPLKFVPFFFSTDNIKDTNVTVYKRRIKLSFMAVLAMLIINSIV